MFKPNIHGRGWLTVVLLLQFILLFFFAGGKNGIQDFKRIFSFAQTEAFSQGMWQETEHFRILYFRTNPQDVALVCSAAETAWQKLAEEGFTESQNRKIFIKIYPDTESLAESFGWEKDEKAMGAYVDGVIGILSPSVWMGENRTQERFNQEGPVLHELTHLLVDEMCAGHYNRWWTEGVAQYMEKKIYHFQMDPPETMEHFYSLEQMTQNFDRLRQRQAYWQALQTIEFIEENYTETMIQEIMQKAAQRKNFEQGFTAALNLDIIKFEQAYEEYIKLKWGTGCSVEQQPIAH